MFERCQDCGSLWETTKCMIEKKQKCRRCCDMDCPDRFICWGRYFQ